jgi:hypothetical protein
LVGSRNVGPQIVPDAFTALALVHANAAAGAGVEDSLNRARSGAATLALRGNRFDNCFALRVHRNEEDRRARRKCSATKVWGYPSTQLGLPIGLGKDEKGSAAEQQQPTESHDKADPADYRDCDKEALNSIHRKSLGPRGKMVKRRALARWLKRLCGYENAPQMAGTATARGKLRRLGPSSRPSFNIR